MGKRTVHSTDQLNLVDIVWIFFFFWFSYAKGKFVKLHYLFLFLKRNLRCGCVCASLELINGFALKIRENEQLSKYGDTKTARSIMLIELKKLIEANPLFRDKLVFPTLKSSRLRTLINQR